MRSHHASSLSGHAPRSRPSLHVAGWPRATAEPRRPNPRPPALPRSPPRLRCLRAACACHPRRRGAAAPEAGPAQLLGSCRHGPHGAAAHLPRSRLRPRRAGAVPWARPPALSAALCARLLGGFGTRASSRALAVAAGADVPLHSLHASSSVHRRCPAAARSSSRSGAASTPRARQVRGGRGCPGGATTWGSARGPPATLACEPRTHWPVTPAAQCCTTASPPPCVQWT